MYVPRARALKCHLRRAAPRRVSQSGQGIATQRTFLLMLGRCDVAGWCETDGSSVNATKRQLECVGLLYSSSEYAQSILREI